MAKCQEEILADMANIVEQNFTNMNRKTTTDGGRSYSLNSSSFKDILLP
ncbi:hypothetical protein M3625_18655 [Paenibacillus sp. MER 78]|nr:hypothetical protein [Paenibacillus sp. MER 78]